MNFWLASNNCNCLSMAAKTLHSYICDPTRNGESFTLSCEMGLYGLTQIKSFGDLYMNDCIFLIANKFNCNY